MKEIKAENPYMNEAIKEALEGITQGHGGPFGAVVVKDDQIIGKGHNRVLGDHDPTCHGEVAAIRDACRNIGTHDLSGSVIYTTGEPCPMCLYACLWANIEKIYCGCTIEDNAAIGFRDEEMAKMIIRIYLMTNQTISDLLFFISPTSILCFENGVGQQH